MHYHSRLLVAATAMTTAVVAQSTPSAPLNPGTIQLSVRQGWCDAQRNSCPLICNSTGTTSNNCDANQLTYTCVCASGATPNVSDYAQTLPSFVCQATQDQCVAATNDAAAQASCRDVKCGSKNATLLAATTSSAAPSSTGGSQSSSSASGSATGAAPSSASTTAAASGAAMALAVGREYGTPALLAGMLAVFGLVV